MTTNGIKVLTIEKNDEHFLFFDGIHETWIKKDAIAAFEYPAIQCLNDLMILNINIYTQSKKYCLSCFLNNSIKSLDELNEYRVSFQEFVTAPMDSGIGIEFVNGSFEEK